jgi:hypothetical protein
LPKTGGAVSESVSSDSNGLRRHFRVTVTPTPPLDFSAASLARRRRFWRRSSLFKGLGAETCHKSKSEPVPLGPKFDTLDQFAAGEGLVPLMTAWIGFLRARARNQWAHEPQMRERKARFLRSPGAGRLRERRGDDRSASHGANRFRAARKADGRQPFFSCRVNLAISLFSKLPLFTAKGVDASASSFGVGALQSTASQDKNKARTLSREILKMSLGCGERDDESLSARDLLE